MELKDHEFSSTSKILARESSAGQSSHIYYRSGDFQGVPFRWEILPGTPLNPQRGDLDIPPLSPPPSMQGLGLPLPTNTSDKEETIKASKYKIKGLKKMAKVMTKAENLSKRVETLVKRRSNKERVARSKLGEKIVLVSHNGVPFKWEKSKNPPKDALTSPPPAVQCSALLSPKAHCIDYDVRESKWAMIRALFLRRKQGIKIKKKDHHEVSFRYNEHARDEIVSCGLNWSNGKILGFVRKKLKFLKL